jgi:hypothetical protein
MRVMAEVEVSGPAQRLVLRAPEWAIRAVGGIIPTMVFTARRAR